MNKIVIGCLILAVPLLALYCAKPNKPEEPLYFVESPMPNEETELMVLYLGEEILAPVALYDRVEKDLQAIRVTHSERFPAVGQIIFTPPFDFVSMIDCTVDSSVRTLIRGGNYRAWDSLNALHELESHRLLDHNRILMQFSGRRHPIRLIEDYLTLRNGPRILDNRLVDLK